MQHTLLGDKPMDDNVKEVLADTLPELDEYILIRLPRNAPASFIRSSNYSRKLIKHAKQYVPNDYWYILNKKTLETVVDRQNAFID